ncbi:MAG: hypothetical protein IPP17_14615 [Bacteroidetes bacterium]|nr:hypothetical protein [Bacteroidota bacterium]
MEPPISDHFDMMLGVLPIRVECSRNHWRIGIKPSSESADEEDALQNAWCLFDAFYLNSHKATYRKLFFERQPINTQDWAIIPMEDNQNDVRTQCRWKVGTGSHEFVLLEDENIRAVIKLIEGFEADPSALFTRLYKSN